MRQFLTVFKFEFSNYLKNKMFVGITVALVIIVAGVLSYPRLSGLTKTGDQQTERAAEVLAVSDRVFPTGALLEGLSAAFPGYSVKETDESEDALKSGVESGRYAAAVYIGSKTGFTYLTKSLGLDEDPVFVIGELVKQAYQGSVLTSLGVSASDAAALLGANIQSRVVETGKSQKDNFFYTYILILSLYMAIMLYGQFVAMGVASEKGSRTMELLITSAKPTQLLFGKVIGSGVAGLTQFAVVFGSAFLFYRLNASLWTGSDLVQKLFDIPPDMLLYVLIFFILGYFLYAFLYGALGSLASRSEDVNTSILPVTFLFIIAFFIVLFSMTNGKIDSPLMAVCSYIPFTSPIAMFTRIAMGSVTFVEILISVLILVISIGLAGNLAARIYRIGVLLYGKPPGLATLVKTLREKKI